MKAEELKTKTVDELAKLLLEKRKEQFNMRFQQSQGTLDNTSQVRKVRRTIARIKTLLAQKGAETQEAPKKPAPKSAKKKAA